MGTNKASNSMVVEYSYYIQDSEGNEFEIGIKAQVSFGSPAEKDEYGRPKELSSGDMVESWQMCWKKADGSFIKFIPDPDEVFPPAMIASMTDKAIELAHERAYELQQEVHEIF